MVKKYRLVYIDDEMEISLSHYLDKHLKDELDGTIELECEEIKFDPNLGYNSLINDIRVRRANIILIDSRLFEDRNASKGKFSGEEFKFIIKRTYPYIEVLVISQNKMDASLQIIPKYNCDCGMSPEEYYDANLLQHIKNAIAQVDLYRTLANSFEENDNWEPLIKERAISNLKGTESYTELTKEDIDRLVIGFKELTEKING